MMSYMAKTQKVSNMMCVRRPPLAFRIAGASVSRAKCRRPKPRGSACWETVTFNPLMNISFV